MVLKLWLTGIINIVEVTVSRMMIPQEDCTVYTTSVFSSECRMSSDGTLTSTVCWKDLHEQPSEEIDAKISDQWCLYWRKHKEGVLLNIRLYFELNDILTNYCDDQEDKSQQCRDVQNYPNMIIEGSLYILMFLYRIKRCM